MPYGQKINIQKLKQIENAEAFIQSIGFPINRVRHYGEHARVEVPQDKVARLLLERQAIENQFKEIGFQAVEIDNEGLFR